MGSIRIARRARNDAGKYVWDTKKPYRYHGDVVWPVMYRSGGRGSREESLGTFRTRALAEERKRWAESCLARGMDPRQEITQAATAETFAEAAKRLRPDRLQLGPTVGPSYDRAIASAGSLARVPVRSLTAQHFRDWLGSRPEAQSTKLLYLTQYRVLLDLVGLDPNPARHRTVKVRGTAARGRGKSGWVPSYSNFNRVLGRLSAPNARIARLIEETGLRSVELDGLRREHIDLSTDTLWVHVTKRSRSGNPKPPRAVPITGSLRKLLLEDFHIDEMEPAERVIGKRARSVGMALTRISKELNIEPAVTPHSLRRRYISRLGRAVIPITDTSDMVGHEQPAMTLNVYSFPIPDEPVERTRLLHDDVIQWINRRSSLPGTS